MLIAEGLCPCALLSVYLNDKCQGFLLGLVFFHCRGDTLPLRLTFSPKSWYNLFLLEGKYQSLSRPKAIFFEGCVGWDCRNSDKEEIVEERARWELRQERVTACTAFSVCSSRQNPERDNDVSTTSRPRAPCLTMWAIQHIPICHNKSIHAPISWPLWIKTCGVKYTSSPTLLHLHCTRNRLMGNWLQLLPPDTWDLCQRCHREKSTHWSGWEIVQSCTHS